LSSAQKSYEFWMAAKEKYGDKLPFSIEEKEPSVNLDEIIVYLISFALLFVIGGSVTLRSIRFGRLIPWSFYLEHRAFVWIANSLIVVSYALLLIWLADVAFVHAFAANNIDIDGTALVVPTILLLAFAIVTIVVVEAGSWVLAFSKN